MNYGSFADEERKSLLHTTITPVSAVRRLHKSEWTEHLDGFSTYHSHVRQMSDGAMALIWDILEAPTLLILVGISSALVAFFTNRLVEFGSYYTWSLVSAPNDYYCWVLYSFWCMGLSLLACAITQMLCKEAVGSGLPEMKTILSGVIKPILLSPQLIAAKLSGLSLALIAGLSIGKEGPFVQVSGALADLWMRLPLFHHIQCQDRKRLEIIACACASGVGATFGTSFGGVLFSIEFTSSAYLVRTLPKAFLTSVCAALVIYCLGYSDQLSLFQERLEAESVQPALWELLVFVALGLTTGLLGVLFVQAVEAISSYRNALLDTKLHSFYTVSTRRYYIVGLVSLGIGIMTYWERSRLSSSIASRLTLSDMIFSEDLVGTESDLLQYFIFKSIVTLLSVTLPLPVGLFTPIFVTGGLLGRLLGEQLGRQGHFAPWEYAMLGAAGLSTGVTRAISTAVIVYEIAGQPHLRLPLSVVVLIAYFVGNRFSKNVYEVLIDTNGTPYMQEIPKALYNVPVARVMLPVTEQHVLSLESTYDDVRVLLAAIHCAEMRSLQDEGLDIPSRASSPSMQFTTPPHCRDSHRAANTGSGNGGGEEEDKGDEGTAETKGKDEESRTATAEDGARKREEVLRIFSPQVVRMTDENAEVAVAVQHYLPTVIPVVTSKRSMVIVGAVLRKDLETAIRQIREHIQIASQPPLVLGLNQEDDRDHVGSAWTGRRGPSTPLTALGGMRRPSQESGKQREERDGAQTAYGEDLEAGLGDLERPIWHVEEVNILSQQVQFVLVTNGGRKIVPIAQPPCSTTEHPFPSHASPYPLPTEMRASPRLGLGSPGPYSCGRSAGQRISSTSLAYALPLDPCPYQMVDSMHLSKVDLLFRMLSLNQAYVTNSGRLVGVITRARLREYLGKFAKRPIDRCKLLCQALGRACWKLFDCEPER